jgi:hypothetical protein
MAYTPAYNYNITVNNPFAVENKGPLDVRAVVKTVSDLTEGIFLKSAYEGLVVYVEDDKSLYVCFNKPRTNKLNSVEDGWTRIDVDYSTRIIDSESNITDGTLKFFYKGMMVYAVNEGSLYIRMVKGMSNEPSDFNTNWKKITSTSASTPTVDKVAIDDAPEGGSGFKISGNKGVIIDDYVNAENYIKAKYAYTSKGVNSFDPNPLFDYNIILSKGGDGYIELYFDDENWMKIHDPNSLDLSVTINGETYISDTLIAKETPVCFGSDIKFHEGWSISYGDVTKEFTSDDYDLIDIYRSEYSPEVYAYRKDIDVRMLTEDDLVTIDDKIDNLAHSIMIDIDGSDGSDSDDVDPMPLQKVIVNMNNAITKLEQTKVEPETIEYSEIDQLFS